MAKGSRPEQAALSRDTDMSKTDATRQVIEGMVDGLNDHRIDDIGAFFAENFHWIGNQGCGTKTGLREFQDNWQRPFQAAFQTRFVLMRRGYIWANGRLRLVARKLYIPDHLWVLSQPERQSKFAIWISGR